MRDAFGGEFMIRLMMVFIVVYVGFGAISLNYAKTFRLKNKIIDIIEQESITSDNVFTSEVKKKINTAVDALDYNKSCGDLGYHGDASHNYGDEFEKVYCYKGIVVRSDTRTDVVGKVRNYEIQVFSEWNLGIMNLAFRASGGGESDPMEGMWVITGIAKVHER